MYRRARPDNAERAEFKSSCAPKFIIRARTYTGAVLRALQLLLNASEALLQPDIIASFGGAHASDIYCDGVMMRLLDIYTGV
jgi:hypothetical protein